MLALVAMMSTNAHALIVSVENEGEVEAEGMEITITEATTDPATGAAMMELKGNVLTEKDLQVVISRSSSGLSDDFCCADECTTGSGKQIDTLVFHPSGMAGWYVHYRPVSGSKETISYIFSDGEESYTITAHYDYSAQGIESTPAETLLRGVWTIGGMKIAEGDSTPLPAGVYIIDGKKQIKQ